MWFKKTRTLFSKMLHQDSWRIIAAEETSMPGWIAWDAWTAAGGYLYLRYQRGKGTIWSAESGLVYSFQSIHPQDGVITLEEFCRRAGLGLDL